MPDSTIEAAARCPRCEQPGVDIGSQSLRGGAQLKTFECKNTRCRWYNTTWVVQINPDGTIPDPTLLREKNFPKLPDRTAAVQAQMDRLYDQTLSGGEIQN